MNVTYFSQHFYTAHSVMFHPWIIYYNETEHSYVKDNVMCHQDCVINIYYTI